MHSQERCAPRGTQKLCLLHPQPPAPDRLVPETRCPWAERNKPYIGCTQTAGRLLLLPAYLCDRFCQESVLNGQGEHSGNSICSSSASFCTLLPPRGIVSILSPFLCIEESFCKWVVFNFKSCDLKNKKLHLLQCMKVKSESEVAQSCRETHGLQPTRLLCPWNFPGKSTGVGCHCLLSDCN